MPFTAMSVTAKCYSASSVVSLFLQIWILKIKYLRITQLKAPFFDIGLYILYSYFFYHNFLIYIISPTQFIHTTKDSFLMYLM